MTHCANAMATVDYRKGLLKEGQFRSGATESTIFLYNRMPVTRNGDKGTTQRKSLDKLHLNPWVSTSKTTFQVLSPEVVMLLLCKKKPTVTTLGFYDDAELKQSKKECISN